MEVLAAPERVWAWVCPECGHGSPEPRDQRAHLDAHRQLRQFIDDWDAAAASDRVVKGRRRRRPVVYAVVVLVVLLLAAAGVRTGRRHDVVPPTGAGPLPAVDVPVPAGPPQSSGPVRPPAVVPPAPSAGPAPARAEPAPAPADAGFAGPPVVTQPAPTAPATPAQPVAGSPRRPDIVVDACLLSLCVDLRVDLPLGGALFRP
jgi:hypothetical protein